MGWWKIGDVATGRISEDWPSGHPQTDDVPINAIPGRDAPDDLYNGDGPADIMGVAVREIDKLFRKAWHRPAYPDEIRACFNFVWNGRLRVLREGAKEDKAPESTKDGPGG